MRFLKALGLFAASLGLTVLIACSSQTPGSQTSSSAPSSSTSPMTMQHGGLSAKKININSAILSELDKLEAKLGVPALSNKIQASRPYGKTEELVSKNVISQAQFDQIKDMVTIEDVVLTGEARDVDYMLKLSLMKGHMMVAKELLDLQKPDQAEPHIGHPVEEIYADVEEQLSDRKVADFKQQLITLQDHVKAGAKDANQIKSDFQASMQAIDAAIAVLPENQRQDPKFVLQVINGLLDTANSEYGAAVADGKVKEAIEYQDSRGFVMHAETLYKGIATKVATTHPAEDKTIAATFTQLLPVWPTVLPPAQPVKLPTEVSPLIKAIETASQKAM